MWRKKHITTFPLERDPQGEFPMGCCKVSTMTMTQKGAVQTTYCFWYWCLVLDLLFMILRKNQETNRWWSKFTTWHKSFEKMGGRFVHNFPWDAVKVSTIPLWFKRMLFKQHGVLIMVFGDYFSVWFLETEQETKRWRSACTKCHKSFKKRWVGGSVQTFFVGCCKSVRYDLKGCCSNNMVFW